MGDSDSEDDKFVKNVMHELNAFQRTKSSSNVANDQSGIRSTDAEVEIKIPVVPERAQNDANPPKPSSRIIRLSRPLNPYGSNKTLRSSSDPKPSVSATSLSSSAPVVINESLSASTNPDPGAGPGAPGSRLAALQRPGSPMHKFLQRSQSPALTAAARITRQITGESTIPNASEIGLKPDTEQSNVDNAKKDPEAGIANLADCPEGNLTNRQSRSMVPPRIQNSGIAGSILLRRPQSPLRNGRQTKLLLNRKTSVNTSEENGETSPKSPLSDDQGSPNQFCSSLDESQPTEKEEIRNKLRANSFRLKDLLTNRPFVKRREQNETVTQDDTAIRTLMKPRREFVLPENPMGLSDGNTEMVWEGSASPRDRTRWRVEGSSLPIGSRIRISERTTTPLSTKSLNLRSSYGVESAEGNTEKEAENTETVRGNINTCSPVDSNNTESSLNVADLRSVTVRNEIYSADDKTLLDSECACENIVSTGATFLRSPRIRNVTSNSKESSYSMSGIVERQGAGETDDNNGAEVVKRAISDLEKESIVNLVFDSGYIGHPDSSNYQETSHENRDSHQCQSKQSGFLSQNNERLKHRIQSEPATPITDLPSMTGSCSYDNTPDEDISRSSPALKRSLAVTDLDKAMRDRDQQKLNSIFKDESINRSNRRPASESEEKKLSVRYTDSQLETDLDAHTSQTHRISHSPRIQHKLGRSLEESHSPPSSTLVQPVAPIVYKPNVNLEDAVKWPTDLPGKLDFRKMEVFEGQMLLNWLTGSIDQFHYLRLVMTKHDISVVACQICTCLVAAGVMKLLENKENETIFKTDCMYYWTHTQNSVMPYSYQDVNKLTPIWPPTMEEMQDTKPGLKYTEAAHQAALVTLRHEYKDEVEQVQTEHKGVLDKAREEYETRLQQAIERIALLEKELEKYKCLAGIEKLTQEALSDADAARVEAGIQPEGLDEFSTPIVGTQSFSQHHTAVIMPESISGVNPLNFEKSPNEMFTDLSTPTELCEEEQQGIRDGAGVPSSLLHPPPPPEIPPPPAPPPPGSVVERLVSMKPLVNPISPMKPLFWQRIQVNDVKTPRNKEYIEKKMVWEEIEEELFDIKELDQLFSKTKIGPSKTLSPNKPKVKVKQVAKVISPKRSQTIGILLSSLRVDMSDIEQAILNFDTSQITEEKLRQIYENRADPDELKKLKEYMKKHPDATLDKPDQFVYHLSLIPECSERMFCFIFQEAFQESISVIETKMTNLRMTCQSLMSSLHVKRILGLVLALGNYMNGGSQSRGQADGFGIDILPKLKDVKSKDNSTSLLHFTVLQYIKKFERQDAGTEKVKLPLPDPSDMNQAALVHFEELDKELNKIKRDFEEAQERAKKVIQFAKEHQYLQPFKDFMESFFERGTKDLTEQEENIVEGKNIFQQAVIFFCVKPKSGDKEVTPEYFFSLWTSFCLDFKDIWKKEQQKIIKLRIKDSEVRVKKIQENLTKKPVRTRTRKSGGKKDRLAKQGLLES